MNSDEEFIDPVNWVRAKTAPPSCRLGVGGQFPGVRKFRRKRWGRVTGRQGQAHCYHVMSRLTDGIDWFQDNEKDALVVLLWKMARFCKVKIMTYCVMDNHFHVLVKVPDHEKVVSKFRRKIDPDGVDLGWERLLTHLGCLYSAKYVEALRTELAAYREAGEDDQIEEIREAFLARMGDLSCFMREVKERFTKWYNKLHERRGGIWQGRFKSVLVEGNHQSSDADGGWSRALRTMALYIDLNPTRAGLVEDPADYRWSGYAAALSGSRRARRGLCRLMRRRRDEWKADVALNYRRLLMSHGLKRRDCSGAKMEEDTDRRRRISEETEESANESRKKRVDLVTTSIPAFTKGLALGKHYFVEAIFEANREKFGEKRKHGSRSIDATSGTLYSLRRIRKRE